jgi:Tfp pilus assembly protein FimT
MTQEAGNTLFEALVVITLSSLLAAGAAFHWREWEQELALQAAAQQVVADLALARLRAAASNCSHRLLLPEGQDRYRVQVRTGSGYQDSAAPRSLPRGVRVASCNAAGSAFTFRPRGNAATFGTLRLRNARGRERAVVVDIAGRVRTQ